VVLEVESLDRMYLNGYVPGLQTEGGFVHFVHFVRKHLGYPIASTAVISPLSKAFVHALEVFVEPQHVEVVTFDKNQRKDDVTKEYLARTSFTEGMLFIGKAQEKAAVFRTIHKRNAETRKSYPWISRGSALPNHYYFYLLDEDFGPLFIKFCSYFPYAVKVCINGHEWVKRQLTTAALPSKPWIMACYPVRTPIACKHSVIRSIAKKSTRCSANGSPACLIHTGQKTVQPIIATIYRFSRQNFH
jgi:hypothetical protein